MKTEQICMRPQDIVVLLKIIAYGEKPWLQEDIAKQLLIGQSELSRSLKRSKYAGLLDSSGHKVRRLALMEFIQYGLPYAFPQRPGALVRGIPTSHSASPLKEQIQSDENYVCPSAQGNLKGQAIIPLYKSVPDAVQQDTKLHEMLSLVDAIRVGNAREQKLAITGLKSRILEK